jgi:hypothetical protein
MVPQVTVVTPIYFITVVANLTGFLMFASVHDDDPTRTVVGSVMVLDTLFDVVASSLDPGLAVVTLTDHTGAQYVGPGAGCTQEVAEAVVSAPVRVASTVKDWRVDIGMCPGFRLQHPEYARGQRDRATYVTVIGGTAAGVMAGVLLLAYFSQRELTLQVSLAKQVGLSLLSTPLMA